MTEPPFTLRPPVRGDAQWSSPTTLVFQPEPGTWATTRTSDLVLDDSISSAGGATLVDEASRRIVFDATPRFVRREGSSRLVPGAPVRLLFEGGLGGIGLDRRLLVYETSGGNRRLPFTLRPGREDDQGLTPVSLDLRTALSPGSSFAVAISPTLVSDGSHPKVLHFDLAPSPRIEGIACPADADSVEACAYRVPPQGIIDFGDALVLLASTPLRPSSEHDVTVRPAVANLSTRAEGRRLVLRAEWSPDQVYEVRVPVLFDAEGNALASTPPLAVRSRGRAPEVHVATGRRTYEHDADPSIHFRAVHADEGAIQVAAVSGLPDARYVLEPDRRFAMWRSNAFGKHELGAFAPTARPNRWGAGRFRWLAPDLGLPSNIAFVSFVPRMPAQDEEIEPSRSTVFVQRTDLGVQAKVLPAGTLVWVTSIQSGRSLDSVAVDVVAEDGRRLGSGKTDASGTLWVPGAHHEKAIVVRARREEDRAVLVVDPRTAVGPSHFGMYGARRDRSLAAPVAFVFADRGVARPGETIHAKAIVFQQGKESDDLRPLTSSTLRLEVSAPGREAPLFARSMRPSRWGTVAADVEIGHDAPLGDYRIEVRRTGFDEPLAHAQFSVRQVRQPVFHIDLETGDRDVVDGEPMPTKVRALYPFGAPATGRTARWVLTRSSGGPPPSRWRGFVFGPVDGRSREGSVERGEAHLDGRGEAMLELRAASSVPHRETATLEVAVQDVAGREAAARTTFRWYPAAFEVGQRRRARWVGAGDALSIEAVAISRDGTPIAGKTLSARFVREGWRRFWTWDHRSDPARGESEGGYRLRTARKRGEVHRCKIVSEAVPVSCTYEPTKAGTYLLEVEAQDEAGRWTISSQRVYVAAPDEQPDRDPPGSPLTLSVREPSYEVGERAEIAFESPFPDAEALITVERDAVLSVERRRVGSGGQTIRIPVTRQMVPNVFVSVSLVRPRTGPPGDKVDLHAPDLRFGATELSVAAPDRELVVDVRTPEAEVRAGRDLPVEVEIKDRQGTPVRCEVALFAVDEGTLRLTGAETPDPATGLSPRLGPSFSWDGLRRNLVSRITPPLPAVMGGGGVMQHGPAKVELRDAFEPTPLWAPQLETDQAGKARTTFALPKRAAEYRVMAVAVDDRARRGHAASKLVAVRDIVVQPSLPRFVREGDRFDAALVVHNTRDAAIDLRFTPEIDGRKGEARTVHLGPRAHERLSVPISVTPASALHTRFEVRTGDDDATVRTTIPVHPRGRWEQAFVVGALRHRHDVELTFPDGAFPAGSRLELATAGHPLVGFTEAVEMLEASPYAGAETAASALVGLAAYASLGELSDQSRAGKELAARARKTLERLVGYQDESGAFAHVVASGSSDPYLTAHALHALNAARVVGWDVPSGAVVPATERLQSYVLGSVFLDDDPDGGRNDLAFALRVLAEAEASEPDRVSALYEQREHLSAYGKAQLAMAMAPGDGRRRSLVSDAVRMVTATREDERSDPRTLRWWQSSNRAVAAVVEAASAEEGFEDELRDMVSRLVQSRMQGRWCSGYETAVSLRALSAYAARFGRTSPPRVTVKLDGRKVEGEAAEGRWLSLPAGPALAGRHRLTIESDRPAFFALSSRWSVPLDARDDVARGRGVALHRVLQTFEGKRIE
ncbi:MAG: alpha-2-macroglobulin family protein, partial [Spirochaetota bacterium]